MSTIEGMAELNRKLTELADPAASQRILRTAVGAGMREVMKVARAAAPVGTRAHKTYKGRLVAPGFASRSLRVITKKTNSGAVAILGVRAEAFYALQFIELGTAKIPKAPWLVPAFEATQDRAIAKLTEHMRARIERVAKGGR